MDKPILRKLMIEKRHLYIGEEKEYSDRIIFDKLKNLLKKYKKIGSYYNFKDEVSTYDINSWILENGKKLYLPKITNKKIDFYNVENLDDVHVGTFNVIEPNNEIITDINEIECIIVPMVAFNAENYRLGFGKAYYDFVLKNYKGYKLGIAYQFQKTRDLEVDSHDVKMDSIVTDI